MSVVRFIYRWIERMKKPSLEANLQSIREAQAKRCEASWFAGERAALADRRTAAVRPAEPIEEVLRRDWELLRTLSAPRSPHVSEEELRTLLDGRDLPRQRQQHYAECKLCRDLASGAHRTDEQIKEVAETLATPPWPARRDHTVAVDEADFEVGGELVRAGEAVPAGARRESALACAGVGASILLVVAMNYERLSDRIALFREGPSRLAHVQSERDEKAALAGRAWERVQHLQVQLDEKTAALAEKEAMLNHLIASKPKVSFSGTTGLETHASGGDASNTRAVFYVEDEGRQITFYLDPATSKQRAEELSQGPIGATVSGHMILDAKKEMVIKVDELRLDRTTSSAHSPMPRKP